MNLKVLTEIKTKLSFIPVMFIEDEFDLKYFGKPASVFEDRADKIFDTVKKNKSDGIVIVYSLVLLGSAMETKLKVNLELVPEETKEMFKTIEELLEIIEIDENIIETIDGLIQKYNDMNEIKTRVAKGEGTDEDRKVLEKEFSFLLLKEAVRDRFIKEDGTIMVYSDYENMLKESYKNYQKQLEENEKQMKANEEKIQANNEQIAKNNKIITELNTTLKEPNEEGLGECLTTAGYESPIEPIAEEDINYHTETENNETNTDNSTM